ncbi:transposase [Streptomyces sp. NPDC049541]|uniref:transposase n=1 Tax=Streptomyces sp. NPDC049541 TaxID=3365594 RepID=UPI00379ACC4A
MVLEGASEAELTEHLGHEKGDGAGSGSCNSRNGTSKKRVLTVWGRWTSGCPETDAGPSRGDLRRGGLTGPDLTVYRQGRG